MKCKDVRSCLYLYADKHELQNLPAEVVQELDECEACRALFEQLVEIERVIAHDGRVPMPDESYFQTLPDEVMARLAAAPVVPGKQKRLFVGEPAKKRWRTSVLRPAFALTVFALLTFVVWHSVPEMPEVAMVPAPREKTAETSDADYPAAEKMETPARSIAPARDKISRAESVPPLAGTEQRRALKKTAAGQPGEAGRAANAARMRSRGGELAASAMQPGLRQAVETEFAPTPAPATELDRTGLLRSETALGAQRDAAPEHAHGIEGFAIPAQKASQSVKSGAISVSVPRQSKASEFVLALRKSQATRSPSHRKKIWQAFLASTQDSTYIAFGILQLSECIKALADSSNELLELANAVDWYEEQAGRLRPLMGESEFTKQLNDLKGRLQRARTGKLR